MRYGHPILPLIEGRATVEAVRAGHNVITAAHLLVSVLEMHEQLTAAERTLPADLVRWNTAGDILARHGVTWQAAARTAAQLTADPGDDEDRLDDLPSRGWRRPSPAGPGVPAKGRTALAALRAASLSAYQQGHPYAGTTHLLVELLADPAGPAARLLRHLQIDPEAVRADALRGLQPPAD